MYLLQRVSTITNLQKLIMCLEIYLDLYSTSKYFMRFKIAISIHLINWLFLIINCAIINIYHRICWEIREWKSGSCFNNIFYYLICYIHSKVKNSSILIYTYYCCIDITTIDNHVLGDDWFNKPRIHSIHNALLPTISNYIITHTHDPSILKNSIKYWNQVIYI